VSKIQRRKIKRFDLELATYLSVANQGNKQESFEFITSNICAGGAFFKTDKPLTVGTDVKLTINLPLGKFENVKHTISYIDVSGSVIRTNHQGMAVCFDRKHKILPYRITDI
jgi:c-di-GMP-binding flagellar brake protein YcgR